MNKCKNKYAGKRHKKINELKETCLFIELNELLKYFKWHFITVETSVKCHDVSRFG